MDIEKHMEDLKFSLSNKIHSLEQRLLEVTRKQDTLSKRSKPEGRIHLTSKLTDSSRRREDLEDNRYSTPNRVNTAFKM